MYSPKSVLTIVSSISTGSGVTGRTSTSSAPGYSLPSGEAGRDTLSVIRKSSDLVLVLKTSCSRNASTDDRRKGVNATEIGTKSNADKSLFCGIGKFQIFLQIECNER